MMEAFKYLMPRFVLVIAIAGICSWSMIQIRDSYRPAPVAELPPSAPVPSTLQSCIDKMPDPGHPVSVLLLDMGASWGNTTWDGEKFIIRMHRDAEYAVLIDVLIHEWAHTLVWDAATEGDHGPLWGTAYARCYRSLGDGTTR